MANSLVKMEAALAKRGAQINEMRKGTVTQGLTDVAIVDGTAFACGYADAKVGDIGGILPSQAAGIGLIVGGVVMRSPAALKAASGALAVTAYNAGKQAAEAMDAPKAP